MALLTFKSVDNMKNQIAEELADEITEGTVFDVGYFDGRQSTKRWIVSNQMYSK